MRWTKKEKRGRRESRRRQGKKPGEVEEYT